jgi:hypothetical protein
MIDTNGSSKKLYSELILDGLFLFFAAIFMDFTGVFANEWAP